MSDPSGAPSVESVLAERQQWLYGNGITHVQDNGSIRCPNSGGIAAFIDDGKCSACGDRVTPEKPSEGGFR